MSSDVVIIGGGPAGAATAISLARRGVGVTVLERRPAPTWKIGETLAPNGWAVLSRLGLEKSFAQEGHLRSFGTCSAWGEPELREQDFICHPAGCAWQLDRPRFELFLLRAAEQAGACVRRGASVHSVTRAKSSWEVETPAGTLRCPWLVEATGRRTCLSRHLAVRRQTWGRLTSVFAVAQTAAHPDQDSRTLIESGPDGWWYTALVPGGRRTISWQTEAPLLHHQTWREPLWFRQKLAGTSHLDRLFTRHGYHFTGPPGMVSAQSSRLECFAGEGWLAAGDAAMSFDPLSGAGICKALETAERVADAIEKGGPSGVASYAEWSEERWREYIASRRSYYAMEQRRPEQPFWNSVVCDPLPN